MLRPDGARRRDIVPDRLDLRACPWCGEVAGWRNPSGAEANALLWRIAWQSTVLSFVDATRHPLGYVPALVGAKGRELACRSCAGIVRVCPACDTPHRWLDARLLACTCGRMFL